MKLECYECGSQQVWFINKVAAERRTYIFSCRVHGVAEGLWEPIDRHQFQEIVLKIDWERARARKGRMTRDFNEVIEAFNRWYTAGAVAGWPPDGEYYRLAKIAFSAGYASAVLKYDAPKQEKGEDESLSG